MEYSFDAARAAIADLDAKLKPIAKRPVDTSDPNWMAKLAAMRPLDEAGIRNEAETQMVALLDAYATASPSMRSAIRDLLRTCSGFSWATGVPQPPTTADGFRYHMLRLSALGQAQDHRDSIVALQELCKEAETAGVKIKPILEEVSLLSENSSPLMRIANKQWWKLW